jgi:phasin family protein
LERRVGTPDGQDECGGELKEETMTKETEPYMDMLRNFGKSYGLPQVDIEKLLETNRKNLEALAESAKVAAGGARSVAEKQREVLQAGLREATTLAREYHPMGSAQEILAKQTEFVKKVFDIAVQGAREQAEVSRQSTSEAVKIIQDRMKASLEEMRGSVSRQSAQPPKS